jgi:glutathione synthase/RimK-type ligase-like ATP-grasp enzyme
MIPFIPEAKDLVTKAASLMPGLRLIGWDVAIGENGPILVEGNSDYGLRGNDMHYGGYRTHPVFKKILEEI